MKLIIPYIVHLKLAAYVNATDLEVSGLGALSTTDKMLRVDNVYLIKQEVSQTETEIDGTGAAEFITHWIGQGKPLEKIKLWWHSHASMKLFWSGTDNKTCRKLTESWMLALVTNHKGEYLARLELRQPFDLSTEIDVTVEMPGSQKIEEAARAEVKEKVKQKVYAFQGKGITRGIMGWTPTAWDAEIKDG